MNHDPNRPWRTIDRIRRPAKVLALVGAIAVAGCGSATSERPGTERSATPRVATQPQPPATAEAITANPDAAICGITDTVPIPTQETLKAALDGRYSEAQLAQLGVHESVGDFEAQLGEDASFTYADINGVQQEVHLSLDSVVQPGELTWTTNQGVCLPH